MGLFDNLIPRDKEDFLVDRKDVHLTLLKDSHSNFRIECFKRKLSMQEVLEEFANRVIENDSEAVKILDDLQEEKRQKRISNLYNSDINTIYDAIKRISPLTNESMKEKINSMPDEDDDDI